MAEEQPQKKKPRGKSIKWTDEQLDEMPMPTPAEIEQAQVVVSADTPELAEIMDAATMGVNDEN